MPAFSRRSLVLFQWVACVWVMGATPAVAQTDVPALVLTNANVIDGMGSAPQRRVTVVIRGGRIESVTTGQGPAGARVIDLGGRWVLPGLIDMHVHLPDLVSAQRALRAGVTTARSMGVVHWVDVGLRELHRAGAADVPDVIAAGYQVTRFPADALFLDAPRLRSLYQRRDHETAFREIVRLNAARRVDVIKVMASQRAGVVDQEPTERMLNDMELALVGAEVRQAGLPMAAHSHTDDGARAATLAGARTIEHGSNIANATLQLMRERNVCLVPTIATWGLQLDGINDNPILSERARRLAPLARDTTRRAVV